MTILAGTLNPAQQAAVRYLDGPLLVLAGAGSGKTRVITQKIGYLLAQDYCAPERIYAVTFTQKAAQEMQARCKAQLARPSRSVHIGTFHTLGLEILRAEHAALGLRANFALFDAYDSERLLKEILVHDSKLRTQPLSAIAAAISQWKNALLDPAQVLAEQEEPEQRLLARAYQRYQRQLTAYHAVDFDDLLRLPVRLWQQQPDCLQAWQARLGYLLVDEYQDTNAAQYALVRSWVGAGQAFTVVGDDAQAIYAWRGAQADNLFQLTQDFPRLQVLKLEQNYRSTPQILAAANQLIANNNIRFAKQLWTALPAGAPVRVLPCPDEQQEAAQVVADLRQHQAAVQGAWEAYAVLYRSNQQARLFEEQLRAQGIPYTVSGGDSFFARPEIKDAVAYLQVLANGADNNALLRIINTPKRDLSPAVLEQLAQFAHQRGLSLLQACAQAAQLTELPGEVAQRLLHLHQLMRQHQTLAERSGGAAGLRQVLDAVRYGVHLDAQAFSSATAERRKRNVASLLTWLARLETQEPALRQPRALVARLTLRDVLERNEAQTRSGVSLMTLHAAKGLEFPHVYLTGLEEALLPHEHSLKEGGIEEERRLCYVGVTRAQQRLTLTYAQTRRSSQQPQPTTPSRFLAELGELSWERQPTNVLPPKETRRQRLAGLRALLEE